MTLRVLSASPFDILLLLLLGVLMKNLSIVAVIIYLLVCLLVSDVDFDIEVTN